MTDKEKIKEEILRRKQSWQHSDKQYEHGGKDVCDYLLGFIDSLPKEPASEDLDRLVISLEETIGTSPHSREVIKEHLQRAAEWQKKKDQETIELAEDHAMLAGMNKMKEEMMKDAVEAEVFIDYNINFGYGSLTANIDLDEQHLKEGDKVKIIICKPEQQ